MQMEKHSCKQCTESNRLHATMKKPHHLCNSTDQLVPDRIHLLSETNSSMVSGTTGETVVNCNQVGRQTP